MNEVIDSKVVELKFDNAQFKKNVAYTLEQLQELEKELKMKDASKGLEDVERTASKFNMDGVVEAVQSVSNKFSAMQVVGITAIANITNSAVNYGKRLVKSLSVDQVSAGFSKMESKAQAVQSIMNSTGKSFGEVNEVMETLMRFSDETSYGFDEMVSAMKQMVTTGGDIHKVSDILMGVANATAFAGQNASAYGRIIYNLAQSYGSGSLQAIDWKSVSLAGGNSKQLVETLIEAGERAGTIRKGQVTIANFQESLKNKWVTKSVMEDAFGQFAYYTKEGMRLMEEEGNGIDTLYDAYEALKTEMEGENNPFLNAALAAQEYLTGSDVISALKDMVSSKWMASFELIIGSYEDAKAFWSSLGDTLTELVEPISRIRNMVLGFWSKLSNGRNYFLGTLGLIYEKLVRIKDTVYDALSDIFGDDFSVLGQKLTDISRRVYEFAYYLRPSEQMLDDLKYIIEALLTPIRFISDTTGEMADGVLPKLAQAIRLVVAIGLRLLRLAVDLPALIVDLVRESDILNKVFQGIKSAGVVIAALIIKGVELIRLGISKIVDASLVIGDFIRESDILNKVSTVFKNIGVYAIAAALGLASLAKKGFEAVVSFGKRCWTTLSTLGTTIKDFFTKTIPSIGVFLTQGLWNGIKTSYEWIKSKVETFCTFIVTTVKNLFGIHSPSTVFAAIGRFLVEGLWVGIFNAGRWIGLKLVKFCNSIVQGVKSLPSLLHKTTGEVNTLNNATASLATKVEPALQGTKTAITDIADTADESSENVFTKIGNFFKKLKDKFVEFKNNVVLFFRTTFASIGYVLGKDKNEELLGALSPEKQGFLDKLRETFDNISASITKFKDTVVDMAKHIDGPTIALILFSVAALAVSGALTSFLENAKATVRGIGSFFTNINNILRKARGKVVTITDVISSIAVITAAVYVFSKIPEDKLKSSVKNLTILIGVLAAFGTLLYTLTTVLPMTSGGEKTFLAATNAIKSLVLSTALLVFTLNFMNDISLDQAAKKVGVILTMATGLALIARVLGGIKMKSTIGAVSMLIFAASVRTMVKTFEVFLTLDGQAISKKIAEFMTVIFAFVLLGAAMNAFTPVSVISFVLFITVLTEELLPKMDQIKAIDTDVISEKIESMSDLFNALIALVAVGGFFGKRVTKAALGMAGAALSVKLLVDVFKSLDVGSLSSISTTTALLIPLILGLSTLLIVVGAATRLAGGKNGGLTEVLNSLGKIFISITMFALGCVAVGTIIGNSHFSKEIKGTMTWLTVAVALVLATLVTIAISFSRYGTKALTAFKGMKNVSYEPMGDALKSFVQMLKGMVPIIIAFGAFVVAMSVVLNSSTMDSTTFGRLIGIVLALLGFVAILGTAAVLIEKFNRTKKHVTEFNRKSTTSEGLLGMAVLLAGISVAILAVSQTFKMLSKEEAIMQAPKFWTDTFARIAAIIGVAAVALPLMATVILALVNKLSEKANIANYLPIIALLTAIESITILLAKAMADMAASLDGVSWESLGKAGTLVGGALLVIPALVHAVNQVYRRIAKSEWDTNNYSEIMKLVAAIPLSISAMVALFTAILTVVSKYSWPDFLKNTGKLAVFLVLAMGSLFAVLQIVGKFCEKLKSWTHMLHDSSDILSRIGLVLSTLTGLLLVITGIAFIAPTISAESIGKAALLCVTAVTVLAVLVGALYLLGKTFSGKEKTLKVVTGAISSLAIPLLAVSALVGLLAAAAYTFSKIPESKVEQISTLMGAVSKALWAMFGIITAIVTAASIVAISGVGWVVVAAVAAIAAVPLLIGAGLYIVGLASKLLAQNLKPMAEGLYAFFAALVSSAMIIFDGRGMLWKVAGLLPVLFLFGEVFGFVSILTIPAAIANGRLGSAISSFFQGLVDACGKLYDTKGMYWRVMGLIPVIAGIGTALGLAVRLISLSGAIILNAAANLLQGIAAVVTAIQDLKMSSSEIAQYIMDIGMSLASMFLLASVLPTTSVFPIMALAGAMMIFSKALGFAMTAIADGLNSMNGADVSKSIDNLKTVTVAMTQLAKVSLGVLGTALTFSAFAWGFSIIAGVDTGALAARIEEFAAALSNLKPEYVEILTTLGPALGAFGFGLLSLSISSLFKKKMSVFVESISLLFDSLWRFEVFDVNNFEDSVEAIARAVERFYEIGKSIGGGKAISFGLLVADLKQLSALIVNLDSGMFEYKAAQTEIAVQTLMLGIENLANVTDARFVNKLKQFVNAFSKLLDTAERTPSAADNMARIPDVILQIADAITGNLESLKEFKKVFSPAQYYLAAAGMYIMVPAMTLLTALYTALFSNIEQGASDSYGAMKDNADSMGRAVKLGCADIDDTYKKSGDYLADLCAQQYGVYDDYMTNVENRTTQAAKATQATWVEYGTIPLGVEELDDIPVPKADAPTSADDRVRLKDWFKNPGDALDRSWSHLVKGTGSSFMSGAMETISSSIDTLWANVKDGDISGAFSGTLEWAGGKIEGLKEAISGWFSGDGSEDNPGLMPKIMGWLGIEQEYDENGNPLSPGDQLSNYIQNMLGDVSDIFPDIEESSGDASDALGNLGETAENLATTLEKRFKTSTFFSEFTRSDPKSNDYLTASKLVLNMESQLAAVQDWSDNIVYLAERGLDQGFLEMLKGMGLEGFEQVRALAEATDEELWSAERAFLAGPDIANSAAAAVEAAIAGTANAFVETLTGEQTSTIESVKYAEVADEKIVPAIGEAANKYEEVTRAVADEREKNAAQQNAALNLAYESAADKIIQALRNTDTSIPINIQINNDPTKLYNYMVNENRRQFKATGNNNFVV